MCECVFVCGTQHVLAVKLNRLRRQNEVKAVDHSVFSPSAGADTGHCTGNGHRTERSRGGRWDENICRK